MKEIIVILNITIPILFAQTETPTKLTIDYWLDNYNQITTGPEFEYANSIFQKVLTVSDKPVGIIPALYVFSDLKPYQIFATKDGGIILPLQIIKHCQRKKIHGASQLAFLLGHEIKHIVRGDYELKEMLLSFIEDVKKTSNDNAIEKISLIPELDRLKALEIQADQYGILYAALAGFDVNSIISQENNFIAEFYELMEFDPYGNLSNPSIHERNKAIHERVDKIVEYLDIFNFATKLYAIGEYDAAIELYTKFLTQFPSREVYNNRGLCYYQKAYNLYKKWRPLDINNNPTFLFILSPQIESTSIFETSSRSMTLNIEKLVLNNINKAIFDLKEAERLDDKYTPILNNLGCVYLLKGDLGFAKDYFKNAIQIDKNNKDAVNNLAICLIAEGDAKEAEKLFLNAIKSHPSYSNLYFNLGKLYSLLDEHQKAQNYFKHYLQAEGNSIYTAKAREYLKIKKQVEALPANIELINNNHPKEIEFNGKEFNTYITPTSKFYIYIDHTNAAVELKYKSDEKIIKIIATDKGYPGKSNNSIKIKDSIKKVKESYSCTKIEIPSYKGMYLYYPEANITFEIENQIVVGWFLSNINHEDSN